MCLKHSNPGESASRLRWRGTQEPDHADEDHRKFLFYIEVAIGKP